MDKKTQISSQLVGLIETIANSKMKKMNFGRGIILYRGEIHLIKVLGDYPGMFISEIARFFSVSRAVISKSIAKLEKHGFVEKKIDMDDKKRIRIFLTPLGKKAFLQHKIFHEEKDSYMFDYLKTLSPMALESISNFLDYAQKMVDHHF
ncbi:MarR family winged helix-turn-helix transcriptional regulator [Pectinatus sottacetonis]|uniref:MarR family winged helix-turn-helix transcriptional regulator n=1 Tax=Pectinatus sottacetonis TaxID=1002795 RepID=UPI0018C667F1|nr:MarR family transcriptional regulator [Pectinatus sottacetonis]